MFWGLSVCCGCKMNWAVASFKWCIFVQSVVHSHRLEFTRWWLNIYNSSIHSVRSSELNTWQISIFELCICLYLLMKMIFNFRNSMRAYGYINACVWLPTESRTKAHQCYVTGRSRACLPKSFEDFVRTTLLRVDWCFSMKVSLDEDPTHHITLGQVILLHKLFSWIYIQSSHNGVNDT